MKFTKGIFATFLVFAFVFAAASTASAYTHSVTLKMGSTGSQVTELQKALNAKGFVVSATGAGSAGMESPYFGAKTKAAVMAFQAANMLTADGVVGPMSGAKLAGTVVSGPTTPTPGCPAGAMYNSMTGAPCGTTTTPTTPTGPLAGTDGSISDVNELGSYNNEEVGEGANDVKVLGFEVEASNDGDISVKSAKISVTITNASGSDNLDDYVDSVSVWMGSTKVGSADASDFNEDSSGVWTKTVSLSNSIVRADDAENFYVAVDAVGSFDSGDIDSEVATFDVENLRFIDGSGVTTTETGYDIDGMNVVAEFVSFSAAADTELKVSTASDSPEAGTVIVDASESTDNVSLLKGKIKIEGDSDVVIDELPITFTATSTGTANGIDDIATTVTLKIGGEEFTETMDITSALTGTITFDNLDLTISSEDTENFEILADITDLDGTVFAAGDTLTASLTATNSDYIDAENEEGDQLVDDTEKTGTASGDAQEFRVTGISVSLVTESGDYPMASVAADGTNTYNDTGTFVIKYKVTAVGDTIYVADGVAATTATSISSTTLGADANLYRLDIGGTATVSAVTDLITYTTDDGAEDSSNGFQLEEGESAVVTMTVARTNTSVYASGGLMRVFLQSIGWNTDDSATFNVYDFNLEDFKTDPISVN
jgi:peptidoglycan hydrolase-like protein with peptidoglycan-binding domain